ncbi:maturase K [Gossypium australe]|uniref:Maturase K n=1 Tax=Gossypium australe TaxID=47621 RepID=A0A5B6W6J7_9ROSI|nr:maturase K [Gossypium australe]
MDVCPGRVKSAPCTWNLNRHTAEAHSRVHRPCGYVRMPRFGTRARATDRTTIDDAANKDDDLKRAKFWLENTIRVFDELSCTSEECLKCAVSLLRDSAYRWWNTLVSVVPRERVSWEIFQEEYQKKYISERFIDHKRKEFLELKQGRMSVTNYEREFIRLSKYARECVSTEAVMCKRFEDGLNEDIYFTLESLN